MLWPPLFGVALVCLVLFAQGWVRYLVGKRQIIVSNDILGFYLGMIGALYGIALAFIMTAAWDNQEQAHQTTYQEAQVLGSIAFYGRGLPHPFDDDIVGQARRYARTVLDQEWPSLSRGLPSAQLDHVSAHLGLSILRYEPSDAHGQALSQQLLTSFNQLRALRSERRLSGEYHIPYAIWALIIFGAVVMLGVCFLLEEKSPRLHSLQTGLIAAFLVMSLVITWDLQNPFRGFSNIDPEPFVHLSTDSFMNEDSWMKLDKEALPADEREAVGNNASQGQDATH